MINKIFTYIFSIVLPIAPSAPTDAPQVTNPKYIEVSEDCLKTDMELLAMRFFAIDRDSFYIKKFFSPSDIEESGMSGEVLFVFNKKDQPIGVLKVIPLQDPEEKKLYHKESSVLIDLSEMQFSEFHPCQIRGIAEEYVCDRHYGVIALDVAPGSSINEIVKNISLHPSDEKIQDLLQASYLTGKALGDLHKTASPSQKIYVHADPHPGNVFFHHDQNQVTFIDFGLTKTVDKNSKDTALDIAKYLTVLELTCQYYNIDFAIYQKAHDKCLQGYKETGPPLDPNRYQFFREDTLEIFCEPITEDNDPRQFEQLSAFQALANNLLLKEKSDQLIS